jgi:hypothetical protein
VADGIRCTAAAHDVRRGPVQPVRHAPTARPRPA